MKYCQNCVMPDTKPDLPFDIDGVCNACRNFERKHGDNSEPIDWSKRESEFLEIVEKNRGKNKLGYDCIVPVSGGKDSTYQVHFIKNITH